MAKEIPIISFNTKRYKDGDNFFHTQKCESCGKKTEILCRFGVDKPVNCVFCKTPLIIIRWAELNGALEDF